MTPVTATGKDNAARHARLFELIRQNAMLAQTGPAAGAADSAPLQPGLHDFARAARRSLLPQEQQALGITSSFGR